MRRSTPDSIESLLTCRSRRKRRDQRSLLLGMTSAFPPCIENRHEQHGYQHLTSKFTKERYSNRAARCRKYTIFGGPGAFVEACLPDSQGNIRSLDPDIVIDTAFLHMPMPDCIGICLSTSANRKSVCVGGESE